MPIYEYQCAACGHTFDNLQKISEPLLTTCPDCGEEALRKLVSAPAFRLKGSGWYETDFKTGNKKNVAQSDKQARTDTKAKADTGTKTKSEGTAKPKKTSGSK